MLLRRHGSSSSSELLPDDLVELILEHVPVMPLLRFRSVSKKWKLTIDSQRFEDRHLISIQSRGPDVLILSLSTLSLEEEPVDDRIFVLGTSIAWTIKLPITCDMYCHGSCDGLFCTFGMYTPSVVANPATGWSLQENIKDSEGKNRRNFVGILLFRRNSDETRRRK
uniref:F-box domain-containing protein n=1 Tax=Brassica oleracea var. oleracea TaxID=109376 RepID=A0A0D3EDS3_BRAOL